MCRLVYEDRVALDPAFRNRYDATVSDDQPAWRRGFNAVEGALGPRLNAVVKSEAFAVAVGLAARAQRTVQERAERNTRRLLHFYNLPAGSDVTRLLAEIGKLQRQVGELTKQLDAAKGSGVRGVGAPGK